ncbi:unnamed protein product [Cuscuta campestris]|uniref:SET domain-containing protein n=1 Tax=Cuscuta campestris TaxID=132261 RepID=A0A484NRG3_9ASTE|nr:unnamed protein product [Cuscuta campestris]
MEEEGEEETSLRSFLRWAAEQGITDYHSSSTQSRSCLGHSLFVSHFPQAGGRGLAAARDLRKGESILRVPKSALITAESLGKEDESLSRALRNHTSLSSTQILALALLNEVNKGKSSCWHTYLKQLPQSYDTLAYFGHFEIQALQVEDAIWSAEKAVQKAKVELKEVSALMCEIKLKPHLMTLKAWLWASATISSRTMHIPWDTAGCLCPVGDFFNYDAPGGVENSEDLFNGPDDLCGSTVARLIDAGYEEDHNAYCFYARRNYRKGEQVLLSYGTYTNLELLEHYGFLLIDNPNDKAFIPLEPNMYRLCSWSGDLIHIHKGGNPSFALLSTLRLWWAPQNARKSVGQNVYSGKQLSPANEVSVMEWISDKCRALLEKLPTSIESDKNLLDFLEKVLEDHEMEVREMPQELLGFYESKKLSGEEEACVITRKRSFDRWKLAIKWRLNFKAILCDCISYCTYNIDEILCQNYSRE